MLRRPLVKVERGNQESAGEHEYPVHCNEWVELPHIRTYASVVSQQQPAHVPDLLGYAPLIVHTA